MTPRVSESDAELQQQRESILRGLLRANAAAGVILCIVIVFAVAGVIAAWRADQNARAVRVASKQAETELWKSRLGEARALRLSGQMGRRERALTALREAARVRPTLEVRNEAIACLAITDLEPHDLLHRFPAQSTAYAVDASLNRFAFGLTNGDISIRRFSDGRELIRLPRPVPKVSSNAIAWRLQFSPDGLRLGTVYAPGFGGYFELQGSNNYVGLSTSPRVGMEALTFSPDGRWLGIVRHGGAARLYDLRDGTRTRADLALPDLWSMSFHPHTNWVALAGGPLVQIQEWPGGKVIHAFTNAQAVAAVRFRPDGDQLALAVNGGGVVLWNLRTHAKVHLALPIGRCYQFDYSPSGRYLSAAMGAGVSTVWDSHTGQVVHKFNDARVAGFALDERSLAFERPREGLGLCEFSPAEVFVALAPAKETEGEQRLWSVDFSADGRRLATADSRSFMMWDLAEATLLSKPVPSRRLTTAWSDPLNAFVTTGWRGASIWGADLREPPREIPLPVHPQLGQGVLASDGRTLAVVADAWDVLLLDLERPEHIRKLKGPASLGHLAFSPDGRLLAGSATMDYGLVVWDVTREQPLHRIRGEHGRVAWSPDGAWVVLGSDEHYTFWRTDTWQKDESRTLSRGNLSDTTGAIAYSQDGRTLALARNRALVQLFDATTGAELASLTAPEPFGVSWLRFSPDGNRLAVATFEGVIQLWNLSKLREQLAALKLNWGAPPTPATLSPVPGGITAFIVLALIGVPLALGAAVFAVGRQRHLLRGYLKVDALAAERSRELARAQTELLHAQKMKALGTLAAGIAHDFNNLLSVMRMSNQLTAEASPGNADVAENVAEVERAVEQGRKLVRAMLGYSRQEADERMPVALPEVVEDTVALLTKQFLSGIALTLELDRDTPLIHASRSRIEQILLNLIVNASEAMDGRGTLRVSVRKLFAAPDSMVLRPRSAAAYLELAIQDSGPGIGPEVLPRIFEPFFTTKNRGATRGTGLGLSMVYTMAEQDGFGISVTTAANAGTTFHVLIPL